MKLNEYQAAAQQTAIYPTLGYPIVYPALGLAGEAGEVAEKVKKLCRDHGGVINDERRIAICKELGDTLWYISETARQAGLTLEEVAAMNIAKLSARTINKTIHGEGDDR
jgi:NTP pyrophosphatase (non-canonical NTP hydrolase)